MNPSPYVTLLVLAAAYVAAIVLNGFGELVVRAWRKRREPKCGRYVCAWCEPQRDLGPAPGLKAGQTSHGICADCMKQHFAEVAHHSKQ